MAKTAAKKTPTRNIIITAIAVCIFFIVNLSGMGGEALGPTGRFYIGAILMMMVIWLSGCLTAAVSSFLLMSVLCVTMPFFVPDTNATAAYKAVFSGYTQSTYALLMSAFAISVAVNKTGLGKRLGILLLKFVGPNPNKLRVGIIIAFPLVNLFVPSVQSVMLIFMAILAGIIEDYDLDLKSNTAKSLYLTLAFAALPDTMYIQTAGAAAIRCNAVIADVFGSSFTYAQYMINGLPLPVLLGIFNYIVVGRMFPSEFKEFPGGGAALKKRVTDFPKITRDERYTAIILSAALFLWITGGTFHNIETGVVALLAATLLFLPKIGVMTFPEAMPKMNWGILLMVGCTSSIASGLVSSGAAKWVVNSIVEGTPIANLPLVVIIVGGLLFVSVIALGFSTRASAVNACLPILATFAVAVAAAHGNSFDPRAMATMLFYPIIFSVTVPVHTPFILQCASANTFEDSEFTRFAIGFVACGIAICVLCFFTYWRWIGLA